MKQNNTISNTINPKLYKMFGVEKYANKLIKEKNTRELQHLEETLSKFILIQGIEDLSDATRQKLKTENIENGVDLYNYLNQHIEKFQERLKDYGRKFQRTILRNCKT